MFKSNQATFNLYVKVKQLKEIAQSLRMIMEMPQPQRQDWLEDHEELLSELMEEFLQESLFSIDGLHLDQEGLELSIELISTMRETMTMVQSISDISD